MLETRLYFCTAQMPSVSFHLEPPGTAKVYSPFRRHKHSLLQPFQALGGFPALERNNPENIFI